MEGLIKSPQDDEVPKLIQFDDDADVHAKPTSLSIRTTRRKLQSSDPEVAIANWTNSASVTDPSKSQKSTGSSNNGRNPDSISELNCVCRCENMDNAAESSTAENPNSGNANQSANCSDNGDEEKECVTPKSSAHRIPEFPIAVCPGAPMKPKPSKRLPPFLRPPALNHQASVIRSVKRRIDFVNPPLITSEFFVPTAADLHNSPDFIKSLFAN